MRKSTIFLAVSVTGMTLGLLNVGDPIVHGLARAFGGIFFGLFLIFRTMEAVIAEQNQLEQAVDARKAERQPNAERPFPSNKNHALAMAA